ncbi:MAG: HD-GYP domain-containing protein [Candidatus Omnitrophica bacterium]|nr:HD-GYP domain-containing protein [Candidatus Omnitrophota bacterium]
MEQLILGCGYPVTMVQTIEEALVVAAQNNFCLVITEFDFDSQGTSDLIVGLRKVNPFVFFMVYSPNFSPQLYTEATKFSISYIITKPIDIDYLLFCVKSCVKQHSFLWSLRKENEIMKEQNVNFQKQNISLVKRLEDSTKNLAKLYEDLRSTYLRTIKALAQAIDARDHYTHSHSQNVANYSVRIAERLKLPLREIELIRQAAELHDIGKIAISDAILLKAAALTMEEWIEIKKHPQVGAQILEPLTFLSEVIELVRQHHERFDGTGYPAGLRAEAIKLGARILHLADAYDAMVTPRAYRIEPFSKGKAVEEIKRNTGSQFDPQVVEAFLDIVESL